MLWTDDAVERLRRMARDGMSASAIAEALGADSRNAVIGKASRMGIKLGGGGPGPARDGATARRAARSGALPHAGPDVRRPASAWTFADAEIGEMRRVRFEDMREIACRWPLGDPGRGDFAYCGLEPAEGRSYCAGHCRMAYRAPNSRAGREPHDPGRSRREFVADSQAR